MSSETRRSSDLRKLDGNPYPGTNDFQDSKPRKVKVAQDMFAGDMPPVYDSQGYQGPLNSRANAKGPCHRCGGHRKGESDVTSATVNSEKSQARTTDCQRCGVKKSMPPSSFPRSAMANVQPRSQSQGPSRSVPIQSSDAGPSGHVHKHKCNKCGRKRRPGSISTSNSSSQSPQSPQAGLSFHNVPQIQTNGIPIMSVEPPTAISQRTSTIPFSPAVGDTPLIKHDGAQPKHVKNRPNVGRSNSISSLFRSLSRRKKDVEGPLPSQKLLSGGEQSPRTIVDKINHAGRPSQDQGYSSLRPQEVPVRPGSPAFSFVDRPKEEQAFEMNDMRKSKQPERRNSWDKADEATNFLSDVSDSERARPAYSRSQSARHTRSTTEQIRTDDVYLTLPPDQRPGITRFKSLRAGVNRASEGLSRSASQISRSTSLRRLESVKKVPSLWYRDDMAIEGAQSEYNNYAY